MTTRELYTFACRVTRAYRSERVGSTSYLKYMTCTPQEIEDAAWSASVNRGMNSVHDGLKMQGAYKRKLWFKTH